MKDNGTPRQPGREDYERALESMDTFIDVSVDDLMALARRAAHFAEQRASESRRVSQIMSQPVLSVDPGTPMSEAAHLMVGQRISGLPVVDAGEHLLGIITEADFLRALGIPVQQAAHNLWQTLEALFGHLAHQGVVERPGDPVSEHMVSDVVCIAPDASVHDALERMKRHRVKRLVICDAQRHVVGIVTRSDMVRLFFDRFTRGGEGASG